MYKNTEKNWYLIYSKPRQEQLACENLTRQAYTVYLPRIIQIQNRRHAGRDSETIAPMFPRYLFIHLNKSTDNWAPIRSTIGVSGLVQFGQYNAVVPDELIRTLQSACNSEGVHESIKKEFQIGEKVRIIHGIARDYEGVIHSTRSSERIELLLSTVAGHTSKVLLPQAWVERTG